MADIDNGYGETMHDDADVELSFDPEGRLVECDAPLGDLPDNLAAILATGWTELTYGLNACVPRGAPDSELLSRITTAPPTVVFMDVGRWGNGRDPQHSFGLVWGTWVALCEFRARSGGTPPTVSRGSNPLNEVIAALCGPESSVRLVKRVWSPSRVAVDWNPIYVILGDLHLPLVVARPATQEHWGEAGGQLVTSYTLRTPEDRWGRYDMNPQSTTSVMQWYDRYTAGDIYDGAGDSLAVFLRLLGAAPMRDRIHFVQSGDMYDLWIGLDRFFQERQRPQVVLQDSGGLAARSFVDHWIQQTDNINSDVLPALHTLPVRQRTFLWGNHDCYLAAYTPGSRPARALEIRRGGILIEHGHACDDANRDGATSGHSLTNQVFVHPIVRSFDPARRDYYLTYAALRYVARPDFAVYVIGHTHSPFLTRLRIRLSTVPARPPPREIPR